MLLELAPRCSRPVLRAVGLLALFSNGAASWGTVVYVNKNSPGATHDGAAWATAFLKVQDGVTSSLSGDEVWVAASIPAATAYVENVMLKDGVALYGGFSGTETARSQRDWKLNVSVIDGNDNDVVTSISLATVLDGFTIRNDTSGTYFRFGVNVSAGTSTITNCNVVGHSYGIYVENASATITNCTFSSNSYAVYQYTGTSIVSNCTLSGNYSGNCTEHGTTTFTNCVFSGNTGEGFATRFGTATVTNCTMTGNTSGVDVYAATVSIINCTLTDNTIGVTSNGGSTTVTNCIIAYNGTGIRRPSTSVAVTPNYNDVYANTTANYVNIADPTGTSGNTSADPLFANRTGGDYRLLLGSPCIDAGDDSVVTPGQTDLGGKPRILGAQVDMGAYEFRANFYTVADAAKALRMAAGLETAPADISHWNVAVSTPGVDLADAVRIARKVAGLEPNP